MYDCKFSKNHDNVVCINISNLKSENLISQILSKIFCDLEKKNFHTTTVFLAQKCPPFNTSILRTFGLYF